MPRWEINLVGAENEKANTWDAVYHIKSRYSETLDADLLTWVRQFALWFVREVGRGKTPNEVSEELPRFIENIIQGHFEDRSFLKAEAFRFLDESCKHPENGGEVKEWLWSFVEYAA